MKINFDDKGFKEQNQTEINSGSYEDMLKLRKKMLPKFQEGLNEVFEDYQGQSFCVVIMEEDENGEPSGAKVMMAGVSLPSTQVKMAHALRNASATALKVMLEAAKDDPKQLIALMESVTKLMEEELED